MEGNHCRCHCCCWEEEGGERGSAARSTSPFIIQTKETRLRRLRQFSTLLMFSAGACALLLLLLLLFLCRHQASHPPAPQSAVSPELFPGTASKLQQTDSTVPSAMLTVADDNITDSKYLLWEHKRGNAFCLGGFNYSNGTLVVPRSGLYRIFLQITYEGTSKFKGKLTQSVFRFSERYKADRPLLSSVDTVNLKHWRKSLYSAGIFCLEVNTLLRVSSSNPELITKNEFLVFFGAEFLGEPSPSDSCLWS